MKSANSLFQSHFAPLPLGAGRPQGLGIRSAKDLEGQTYRHRTGERDAPLLEKNGVKAEVEFSWGATEVKCPHW
jgi:hypothetical protein